MSDLTKRASARGMLLAGVSAVAGALAMTAPAAAQAQDATVLDELIVTVRKREETVLTVPMSIAAYGAEQLERKGVKDLEELSRSVPGLVAVQNPDGDGKYFVMRGIKPGFDTAATVAVYLDDTPLTVGASSPDLKLFDVGRVEVLRGPQGTLFGSNSLGGAIRYISPAMDFDAFHGRAKVEVGQIDGGGQTYEVQAAAGGPVSDRLAFRASAWGRRDGGWIDVVDEVTGQVVNDEANSVDSWGGRLALGARPNDQVEVTASLLVQQQNVHDMPNFYTHRGQDPLTAIPLKPFQRLERMPVESKRRFFLPNVTLKADLGFGELTSSTSYMSRENRQDNDYSYFLQGLLMSVFGVGEADSNQLLTSSVARIKYDAVVQEVRVASNPGRFEWLVGGYYRQSTADGNQVIDSPNLGAVIPDFDGLLVFSNRGKTKTRQLAVFGEVSYTLADVLKLTAGLRLTELQLEFDQTLDGVFNGGQTHVGGGQENKPVTPKFSAVYQPSQDAMAYVSATKGFREGGVNPPVPQAQCQSEFDILGIDGAPAAFDPDTLWSYEVGGKMRTADRRFHAAAAAYQLDWDQIQQNVDLRCGFAYITNLGAARVRGIELEASWRATDNLSFDLTFGTSRGELTQDAITGGDPVDGPIVNAPKGRKLPGVPDWTASLAAQYDFHIGELNAYARGEATYVGQQTRTLGGLTDDPTAVSQDDYTLVSLRAAVSNERWEVAVFADNLTNEDTILGVQHGALSPWGGAIRSTFRPRVIGISAAAKF